MARIVYLGDEATATAFRLAGVDARSITASAAADELRRVRAGDAQCVLLSGALLPHLPPGLLADALAAPSPLCAVVPDIRADAAWGDFAREVRGALGIWA